MNWRWVGQVLKIPRLLPCVPSIALVPTTSRRQQKPPLIGSLHNYPHLGGAAVSFFQNESSDVRFPLPSLTLPSTYAKELEIKGRQKFFKCSKCSSHCTSLRNNKTQVQIQLKQEYVPSLSHHVEQGFLSSIAMLCLFPAPTFSQT